MRNVTQGERILDVIQANGYTTVRELFNLGINSPTKRISELREQGYDITSETVKTTNQFGEKTHYNKYRMETK